MRFAFLRRFDWSNPTTWKAAAWSLPLSALFGALAAGWSIRSGVPLAAPFLGLFVFVATDLVSIALVEALVGLSWRAVAPFLAPSGRGTPSLDDYSLEKSLLARGRVDEALTALQVHLANHPDDPTLCLLIADVYAWQKDDARRAEGYYRRARESPAATPAHDYEATNRLIDLYLGPLDDARRAAEELERIRDRHAGSQGAAHAESALKRLRAG